MAIDYWMGNRGHEIVFSRDPQGSEIARNTGSHLLLFLGRFGEFERGLPDDFGDRAAADALRAYTDRFARAVCRAYVYVLQIRLELPPGNTGYLRAYAA
jgi:hypothetical protein